jgi:hypothetical protein
MADGGSDWISVFAAATALLSLGWQVVASINQSKFNNYENEFGRIEGLVDDVRAGGIEYWSSSVRNQQLERTLINTLDDLISKLDSLQDKRIIAKAPYLDRDLLALKRAVTLSNSFASANWVPEPERTTDIRRAADNLVHRFLMLRS